MSRTYKIFIKTQWALTLFSSDPFKNSVKAIGGVCKKKLHLKCFLKCQGFLDFFKHLLYPMDPLCKEMKFIYQMGILHVIYPYCGDLSTQWHLPTLLTKYHLFLGDSWIHSLILHSFLELQMYSSASFLDIFPGSLWGHVHNRTQYSLPDPCLPYCWSITSSSWLSVESISLLKTCNSFYSYLV